MVVTAPRIFLTASLPSGPGVLDDGCRPSASCAALARAGRSSLSLTRASAFDEHDLGSALDQLLGAADGLGRVIDDGALDAIQLFLDGGWVSQCGHGLQRMGSAVVGRRGDQSGAGVVDGAPVSAQRVVEALEERTVLPVDQQPFKDPKCAADVTGV